MTMFSNKLAVAIKTAGKVLREQKDSVYLPFGSEYSVYIKNLNTVRALVRVEIDGVNVTEGTDLIVDANSSLDLERFLKSGNLREGNRFKFIERTGKVEAHRGVKAEDGIVRVEFQFEKVVPKVDYAQVMKEWAEKKDKEIHHYHHYDYWRRPYWGSPWYNPGYNPDYYGSGFNTYGAGGSCSSSNAVPTMLMNASSSGVSGNITTTGGMGSTINANADAPVANSGILRSASVNVNFCSTQAAVNDAGITVEGSVSNQQFQSVAGFPVEDEKHAIVLKLFGQVGPKAVNAAVTVKRSQTCKTCGTRNRGKLASFCRECGTALEIV